MPPNGSIDPRILVKLLHARIIRKRLLILAAKDEKMELAETDDIRPEEIPQTATFSG